MSCQKELSKDPRSRIANLHKAGKGYKVTSKTLEIHQSIVRQTMCKWGHFGNGQGDSSKKWTPYQHESKITTETHQWNTGVHEFRLIKETVTSWLDTTKETTGVEEGTANHHGNISLTTSMLEETSSRGPVWALPPGNHCGGPNSQVYKNKKLHSG